MAVARFHDHEGREVELTEAGWAHVLSRRPELAGQLDLVREAVERPDRVRRDALIHRAENHYLTVAGRMMVKVVILYRPTPSGWVGEILTVHPTKRFGKGEQHLWP